jgi:hypothetical protein
MYGKPGTGKLTGFIVFDDREDGLDEMIAAAKLPDKRRQAKLREIAARNKERARQSAQARIAAILKGDR